MRLLRFCFFVCLLLGLPLAAFAAPNHPKILIIYDMEGVSCVTHYEMLWVERPGEYAKGRECLTSDVNAAVRGLAAGGAGSIWIQDSHAKFDFRDHDFDPYNTGIDASVDAIVCMDMHAHANTDGFMAHTVTDRI